MRTETERRSDFGAQHILLWRVNSVDHGVQYHHAMETDGVIDHGVSDLHHSRIVDDARFSGVVAGQGKTFKSTPKSQQTERESVVR